ncbi:MAG TPA: TonB-dependent receptor, partial [Novosphingobium sp.]|nr:TonB-dependent receptor [Novosphingobium sp.]
MISTTPRTLAQGASTLAIGCLGLFSPVFPAMAQTVPAKGSDDDARTSQAPANLGGVTVTDTAIDEGGYKTERLSSAKATADLVDTPRSIAVVSRQLIEDTNSSTLAEALRTVPGITLGAGEGGNPLGDRPFIRGADASASTYLDGVRDLAAQTRETFDVEAIEITKGSDSVTNGSGNAGGSINIVSKGPEKRRFVRAEGSLGNADYKRATIDINQPLSDFVGVRINAMYHDQGIAGRDAIWQRRWGIAPSIKFGLNGPTSLQFDWYHLHSNELPDSGIPYYSTLANQNSANAETAPAGTTVRSRGAFYGLASRDFRTTNTDDFTARFEHNFENGLKLRNTARYSRTTQEYVVTQPDDSKGNVASYGTVSRRANTRYSTQDGMVDQIDLSGKFATGALKHSFAAAAEYSWQKTVYGSYFNTTAGTAMPTAGTCLTATSGTNSNCTSLANPNYNDSWAGTLVKGPANSQTIANNSTFAISLFDTISIGERWKINLGGRYDHYLTHASAALASPYVGTRTWQRRQDDLFSYQAALLYKPAANGTLYISTATSAVGPGTFLGQGSEDNAVASATIDPATLKPQRTTSYEVGTKWNFFNDNLAVTFDVFQTRTTNARITDPVTSLPTFIGTKRVRGVELSVSGNITPQWNVFGGYAFMPSKVTNGGLTSVTVNGVTSYVAAASNGKPFPNTPRNSLTLFTNYKVTPKLTFGGGAIYMDKVYGGFSVGATT